MAVLARLVRKGLMNHAEIQCRYARLLQELKLRMTKSGRWMGAPGLLDDLHALRCQYMALPPVPALAASTVPPALMQPGRRDSGVHGRAP
jgi:hypothetical protein